MPRCHRFSTARVMLATAMMLVGTSGTQIKAASFGQQELDPTRVIAIASPVDDGAAFQLLVLEQVNNQQRCWQQRQDGAGTVDPLLLNFDFTGICGRATDSNGYSLRVGGEDLGWRYSLRVIQREGYLVLVGIPVDRAEYPTLELGRTRQVTNDFSAIELYPGWRLTKRTFGDRPLGHFYLTHDESLATLAAANRPSAPVSEILTPSPPQPASPWPVPTVPPTVVTPVPAPPATVPPAPTVVGPAASDVVVVETIDTNGDRVVEFGVPTPAPAPRPLPPRSTPDQEVVPVLPPPPPSPLL